MKHLLDTRDLTRTQAIEILDVADYMAQVKAENRKLNVLAARTVVNLFFEDSTRTRLSFEIRRENVWAPISPILLRVVHRFLRENPSKTLLRLSKRLVRMPS